MAAYPKSFVTTVDKQMLTSELEAHILETCHLEVSRFQTATFRFSRPSSAMMVYTFDVVMQSVPSYRFW